MEAELKEFNVQDPPSDGVSQVVFSKQSKNLLVASSWDKVIDSVGTVAITVIDIAFV